MAIIGYLSHFAKSAIWFKILKQLSLDMRYFRFCKFSAILVSIRFQEHVFGSWVSFRFRIRSISPFYAERQRGGCWQQIEEKKRREGKWSDDDMPIPLKKLFCAYPPSAEEPCWRQAFPAGGTKGFSFGEKEKKRAWKMILAKFRYSNHEIVHKMLWMTS